MHPRRVSHGLAQTFAGRKNRLFLEVAGTDGSMVWDSENPGSSGHRRGQPSQIFQRDPSLMDPTAAEFSHYPGRPREGFPIPSSSST